MKRGSESVVRGAPCHLSCAGRTAIFNAQPIRFDQDDDSEDADDYDAYCIAETRQHPTSRKKQ